MAKISTDSDADGYSTAQGDCADNNAAVYPNATEVCDSIDNDCNDQMDEGLLTTFYRDDDNDGYGSATSSQQACSQPAGYAANNTDCNDSDAAVHPGASETCNGRDDNCNTATDEAPSSLTAPLTQSCYNGPADTAGVGICHTGTQTCINGSFDSCSGEVTPTTETCNTLDDNCDGSIDEGVQTIFYRDADGDGYGDLATTTQACAAPSGYVASNTDCNDANNAIHPGVNEVCDAQDNNCDGVVDNGFTVGVTCNVGVGACQQMGLTVCAANGLSTVCDAVAGIPTAELCGDSIDQDCNGVADEGFDVGAACSVGIGACRQNGTKVCASDGLSTQCNATAGSPTPEICSDGIDQDCNGADLICPPPTGFRVLTPNGGETWRIGTRQTIRWDPANLRGIAVVELSRNGGQTWTRIISIDRARATSTDWIVRGPATAQARVRVVVFTLQGVFVDVGDGNFTIQP